MFKFLKNKLKGAIDKISKKVDEESKEEIVEQKAGLSKDEAFQRPASLPVGERTEIKKVVEKPASEEKPQSEKQEAKNESATLSKPELSKPEEKPITPVEEKKQESAKAEEKPAVSVQEQSKEETKQKPPEPKIEKQKPASQELLEEVKKEEIASVEKVKPAVEAKPESTTEPKQETVLKKKGFFGKLKQKIVTKTINEKQFDEIFWDLELVLLENNVAVEVIEKIKSDLKQKLINQPLARAKTSDIIIESLNKTIKSLFDVEPIDLLEKINQKKPLVICLVGINGSGKTTTIAKLVKYFKDNNKSSVIAASDTFRAAAIDQLQIHADKLGVKLIKHDYGSDAAAVAFDAVKHAESKNIDVVLIDTAGRIHSNVNLVDEMKKIIRVAKPDLKIFVAESITGNDAVLQSQKFNEAIGIDGIILTKSDIDEKGGAIISVSYVTKKPIIFIGTGQEYADLIKFKPEILMKNLKL